MKLTIQTETDGIKVVKTLIDVNINWANWLVVRLMTRKQKIQYAIYAAEQVIEIYEKKYPDDSRPRKAIEAAKAYLKNPTKKNKDVAARAADAADAAADAAYAADAAARAADAAAYAAARAADAAYAAYAAAYAADAAADAAAYAADAATKKEMQVKIINYGINLIS